MESQLGQRIVVIGCAGSGKSTLSLALGKRLDLPVHHLDRVFWQPGWTELEREAFHAEQRRLCSGQRWIIDGNYGGTLALRGARADTVIWLDLPRRVCLRRVFWRILRHMGRPRPDMGPGCPERVDWIFLNWIWSFDRKSRPDLERFCETIRGRAEVIQLRSRGEVSAFMDEIGTGR